MNDDLGTLASTEEGLWEGFEFCMDTTKNPIVFVDEAPPHNNTPAPQQYPLIVHTPPPPPQQQQQPWLVHTPPPPPQQQQQPWLVHTPPAPPQYLHPVAIPKQRKRTTTTKRSLPSEAGAEPSKKKRCGVKIQEETQKRLILRLHDSDGRPRQDTPCGKMWFCLSEVDLNKVVYRLSTHDRRIILQRLLSLFFPAGTVITVGDIDDMNRKEDTTYLTEEHHFVLRRPSNRQQEEQAEVEARRFAELAALQARHGGGGGDQQQYPFIDHFETSSTSFEPEGDAPYDQQQNCNCDLCCQQSSVAMEAANMASSSTSSFSVITATVTTTTAAAAAAAEEPFPFLLLSQVITQHADAPLRTPSWPLEETEIVQHHDSSSSSSSLALKQVTIEQGTTTTTKTIQQLEEANRMFREALENMKAAQSFYTEALVSKHRARDALLEKHGIASVAELMDKNEQLKNRLAQDKILLEQLQDEEKNNQAKLDKLIVAEEAMKVALM